jgi:hypothetical protein
MQYVVTWNASVGKKRNNSLLDSICVTAIDLLESINHALRHGFDSPRAAVTDDVLKGVALRVF